MTGGYWHQPAWHYQPKRDIETLRLATGKRALNLRPNPVIVLEQPKYIGAWQMIYLEQSGCKVEDF